jgi:hypothetical protein
MFRIKFCAGAGIHNLGGMESALLTRSGGSTAHVPVKDGLVLVGGEVLFPNTIAVEQRLPVPDYIERAGGYNQNADLSRGVVAHRDVSFDEAIDGFFSGSIVQVRAGDNILVLPKVNTKFHKCCFS